MSAVDLPRRPEWDRIQRAALAAGIVGLGLCVLGGVAGHLLTGESEGGLLGWLFDRAQFFRSYLVAYLFVLGIGLGSWVILMVHHLTGGDWGWALRGVLQAGTRTIPLLVLLFLPLLLGLHDLYPWARWTEEQIRESKTFQSKSLYLNQPFFLARAFVYLATWVVLSVLLLRSSAGLPRSPTEPEPRRLRLLISPGLLAYGLTITFASIDWVMSIEPLWYSTIYGPLFATGQALSGMAFAIAALVWLAPPAEFSAVITRKHLRDLGNLMLAFILLWAYMSFSQFLLIWSGNLPEEIVWYKRRLQGGWEFVGVLLILLHFVLPFLLLLSRDVKHNPRTLATVAALLLGIHLVDLYWVVVPGFFPFQSFRLHWMDIAAVVGVGGIWLAFFLRELRQPLLPEPVNTEGHHG
jgi:hypothetical protein